MPSRHSFSVRRKPVQRFATAQSLSPVQPIDVLQPPGAFASHDRDPQGLAMTTELCVMIAGNAIVSATRLLQGKITQQS